MKKSFVMYTDWKAMVEEMDNENRGELLLAIMKYQSGEEIPHLNPTARVAFACMKTQFDKDQQKYEETMKRRSEAGKIAAKARLDASNRNESQPIVTNRNESLHDNDNDNDNDNVNDNEKDNKESRRNKFVPPTVEEVQAYADEKGYSIDAARFVDFYGSKGWMVGKNKMKDWKSAVRNWSRSDKARKEEAAKPKKNQFNNFDQREYDELELERMLLNRPYGGASG